MALNYSLFIKTVTILQLNIKIWNLQSYIIFYLLKNHIHVYVHIHTYTCTCFARTTHQQYHIIYHTTFYKDTYYIKYLIIFFTLKCTYILATYSRSVIFFVLCFSNDLNPYKVTFRVLNFKGAVQKITLLVKIATKLFREIHNYLSLIGQKQDFSILIPCTLA